MRIRGAYISVARAVCFSVTLFGLFLVFFRKETAKNVLRIWLESCKDVLGTHLGAPWEAPDAQNASRSEKTY